MLILFLQLYFAISFHQTPVFNFLTHYTTLPLAKTARKLAKGTSYIDLVKLQEFVLFFLIELITTKNKLFSMPTSIFTFS